MDDLEIFAFLVCIVLVLVGLGVNRLNALHGLYFRRNPAPGIVRLSVILAMGWIFWVLLYRADPSVTAIYVLFYMVMGYAVVKLLGQKWASLYGARGRVDVVERRSVPAALLVGSFTLATGLIFGGSLWGEADPVGDDEGGFWIPGAFFLAGWICLLIAFRLFRRREGRNFAQRLHRERSLPDMWAASLFLLAAGVTLADAVAGDFWGWRHGLLTFGVLAGLLLAHEAFAGWKGADGTSRPPPRGGGRFLEGSVYALLALGAWGANRFLDRMLTGG